MGDEFAPLLSSPDSPSTKPPPSLDSTIERCVGHLGFAQFLQPLLVSLAWFFDAQQTFLAIFTDLDPKWHCTRIHDLSCHSFSDICQIPRDSWAWDSPPHSSIVSEWDLQCAPSFVSGLPASSFFMGCLLGGFILATLADSSLGRKNTLFLSCLIMSFSSLLTALSPNIWIYSALRLLSGFGRATIGTSALVLSTELVGKRWRGQIGVLGFFGFTLGFLSLPLLAYACRGTSWRNLYIWTSIPTIIYSVLLHFLVRESPRWLFVRGRKEEAIDSLKSIAAANHGSVSMSFSGMSLEPDTSNINLYSAMKMLLCKKWSLRRLCAVMAVSLGTGMAYYGMPLGLGNLGINLYLSVTLNALSELPASLFTFLLIGKINRRGTLVAFTMVSGICSVMSVIKGGSSGGWRRLQIGLELVSFFSACTVVNVLLIFTIELFPTCVRNSAMAMVRQALVVGGALSSMLAVAGRKNEFLSYGVFGIVIACGGVFAACLPETKGRSISDTMEEEEEEEEEAANSNSHCCKEGLFIVTVTL